MVLAAPSVLAAGLRTQVLTVSMECANHGHVTQAILCVEVSVVHLDLVATKSVQISRSTPTTVAYAATPVPNRTPRTHLFSVPAGSVTDGTVTQALRQTASLAFQTNAPVE